MAQSLLEQTLGHFLGDFPVETYTISYTEITFQGAQDIFFFILHLLK